MFILLKQMLNKNNNIHRQKNCYFVARMICICKYKKIHHNKTSICYDEFKRGRTNVSIVVVSEVSCASLSVYDDF